jgi:hypothetical protein
METKDFIKFIEDLSFVKDIEVKAEMIKDELKKLEQMIKESDVNKYSSRMERLQKKTEYNEILSYKNVLSFRLSMLQPNNDFE